MPEKNTCILLFTTYEDVWQAIKTLQAHKFNLKDVSVLANKNDENEQLPGLDTNNVSKYLQDAQTDFWEKLCKLLDVELYFLMSELSTLCATGGIVSMLQQDKSDTDIEGQFSALAEALFNMGIPANSIRQYETEIISGAILLIINSKRDEVERSCEVLHNTKQRATVHLA